MVRKLVLRLFTTVLFAFLLCNTVQAAGTATMSVTTSSPKYTNQVFDIVIKVTGSVPLQGFQADVALDNLTATNIKNVNSNITWLPGHNPTTGNLSFIALLGSPVTSLDAFTISVKAGNLGAAHINLANVKVGGADPIEYLGISNITNGTYSIIRRPAATTQPAGQVAGLETSVTPTLCVPACTDKECGDDGCGGSCGTCDSGYYCTDAYTCDLNPDTDNTAITNTPLANLAPAQTDQGNTTLLFVFSAGLFLILLIMVIFLLKKDRKKETQEQLTATTTGIPVTPSAPVTPAPPVVPTATF